MHDIGGGHGALLAHILEHNPQSSRRLLDAPSVIAGATGAIDTQVNQGAWKKSQATFSRQYQTVVMRTS